MNELPEPQLVPLRIPTGWSVVFNKFWEVDPIVENEKLVNYSDFTDNLLTISRVVPVDMSWPRFIIDLGWHPPETPQGFYRLTLIQGDYNSVLKEYETASRDDMRLKIEHWLAVLSKHYYDKSGVNLL